MCRSLPGATNLDGSRIAEVQIGSDGLSAQPHTPTVFGSLPERILRVRNRERLFLSSEFKVDPATVRFNVRKSGAHLRGRLSRRSYRNLRGSLQEILDVPAPIVTAHKVEAGLSQTEP